MSALMTTKHCQLVKWINDNDPPSSLSYSKGWWHYAELLQRIAAKLDADEARVIDRYLVEDAPMRQEVEALAERIDDIATTEIAER